MKPFTGLFGVGLLSIILHAGSSASAAPHLGAPPSPRVIARVHYAGVEGLGETNGSTFKEVWNLPASAELRGDTLAKLAARLSGFFEPKTAGQTGYSALLRPLLQDLLSNEAALEIVEHPQDLLEWFLVVRLDEARQKVWQANWDQLRSEWKSQSKLPVELYPLAVTNSWVTARWAIGTAGNVGGILAAGPSLSRLLRAERPADLDGNHVFNGEADLARLAVWAASSDGKGLPRVEFTLGGRKEYVRSVARLEFEEPLPVELGKWEVPTETIRDPLISFTALQGIASWLKRQPFFQGLGLASAPNQLYFWGLSQTAFQLQSAVPMPNAAAAVNQITQKSLGALNRTLAEYAVGNVLRLTDRVELVWRGLPLLVPYLKTAQEGDREFLHAGVFPVDPPTNAAPPQLFQQLTSQTNLLYYDWEVTQARLNQLRPLLQLGAVIFTIAPMSTNSSASKWLDAVEPRLGNTITEVTLTSPRELRLVRTSHLGLNGMELLALASWLEGTNFPTLNPGLSFRPVIRPNKPK